MNSVVFHEKGFHMEYLCLLGEGLWYEILVPALEIWALHEKGFYERGGEEYWDVFMGTKVVEFQSERVWEWSLEEL